MNLSLTLLAAFLLVALLAAVYLLSTLLDWLVAREKLPRELRSATFAAHVAADLHARLQSARERWRERGSTWSRTGWWLGSCLAGGISIAVWIGGTEYLQSWVAAVFRACSGAVVGFLVVRFLMRVNVSQVASRYPEGSPQQAQAAGMALLASALTIGAAVIAVAVGM